MHRRYCTAHPAHAEGRLTGSPTAGFLADDRCRKLPIALVSIIGGSSRPMPDFGAIGAVGKSDSKVRLRAESSHFGRIRSQLSRRAVLSGLRQLLSRWIPDSWRGQGFWASYERRAALFPWSASTRRRSPARSGPVLAGWQFRQRLRPLAAFRGSCPWLVKRPRGHLVWRPI